MADLGLLPHGPRFANLGPWSRGSQGTGGRGDLVLLAVLTVRPHQAAAKHSRIEL